MIKDTIQSPWDSIISSIKTIATEYSTLKIYPNPAGEYSNIEVSTNCQGNVNLSLYDMQGEELQTIFNGTFTSGTRKFVCQTGALSSGIYFITLRSACETESVKLIKF